jgi:L-lactate dehydrogenase complex protein LldE
MNQLKIGLFIPCYIDQMYPHVGMSCLSVLERYCANVEYPTGQTCCGQPMANSGCTKDAKPLAQNFLKLFKDYDAVVCPSGSCVSMIRNHYDQFLKGEPGFLELKNKTYELCEFLVDVLKIPPLTGAFPHRVGIHQSCHGLRELRLASSSELRISSFNKLRSLLVNMQGIELVDLTRTDECCGFGGMFSIGEEALSCSMGNDRIADHEQAHSEIITAADMSCLMHMDGLIRRQKKSLRVMHIAEILSESGK